MPDVPLLQLLEFGGAIPDHEVHQAIGEPSVGYRLTATLPSAQSVTWFSCYIALATSRILQIGANFRVAGRRSGMSNIGVEDAPIAGDRMGIRRIVGILLVVQVS